MLGVWADVGSESASAALRPHWTPRVTTNIKHDRKPYDCTIFSRKVIATRNPLYTAAKRRRREAEIQPC